MFYSIDTLLRTMWWITYVLLRGLTNDQRGWPVPFLPVGIDNEPIFEFELINDCKNI